MNMIRTALLSFALVTAGTASLSAQTAAPAQPRPRISPHETISARIDGDRVMIVYGRPYSKDPKTGQLRQIWGALVPYGKVWRTGADEATLLTTAQPIVLGGTDIPAGTYSLFTLPAADGTAKLIVNKRTGQWGIPYKESSEATNELARIDLKKAALDKTVDQFTMAIDNNPSGGGVLTMSWENTQFSVPIAVKK